MRQEVFKSPGYSIQLSLSHLELTRLREIVSNQYFSVLHQNYPTMKKRFSGTQVDEYHLISELVDHKKLWTDKMNRTPRAEVAKEIMRMDFMNDLRSELGDITIYGESEFGFEEFNWRVVRPGVAEDSAILHADSWFWNLGHGVPPKDMTRLKTWIPLYCEPGLNGLEVVPDSHLKSWKYTSEERDGLTKPRIAEFPAQDQILLLETEPGNMIVFNDDLLHGGAVNRGKRTRVSIEFTIFLPKPKMD